MAPRLAPMVVIVASAALLCGCAPTVELPAGPTEAEVKAIIDRQNREWWHSIAPNDPYPEIEPIQYLEPGENDRVLTDCLDAIPAGDQESWERATFVCSMQYPYRMSDPEKTGYLSAGQLEYLYDYFTTRLAPCLEFIGYSVAAPPSKEAFLELDYAGWSPYYVMSPQPTSKQEWERVDVRCAVPPIGDYWRPGLDYTAG